MIICVIHTGSDDNMRYPLVRLRDSAVLRRLLPIRPFARSVWSPSYWACVWCFALSSCSRLCSLYSALCYSAVHCTLYIVVQITALTLQHSTVQFRTLEHGTEQSNLSNFGDSPLYLNLKCLETMRFTSAENARGIEIHFCFYMIV